MCRQLTCCMRPSARYLNDPAGQAQFVAEKLELAAVQPLPDGPAAPLPPAAQKAGSRPSTSSSACIVGGFGYYSAWALLDLLLAEWLARAWARAQAMARLRRCAIGWMEHRRHTLRPGTSTLNKHSSAVTQTLKPGLVPCREAAGLQPPPGQQAAVQAADGDQLDRLREAYTLLQAVLGPASSLPPGGASSPGSAGAASARQPAQVDAEALLVQDATATDVEAAWQAYRLLQHAGGRTLSS